METLAKKLILLLASFSLISCAAEREDNSRWITPVSKETKPHVVELDGYKVAKGSLKIDDIKINYDDQSKNISLVGRLEFKHIKTGAPSSVNINLLGTVDSEGFASLKSLDSQNETLQVAAKATCLGSEGDCHSSFVDIYVKADGVVYHHQVESIANDFGDDGEEFDPSMATEVADDGIEEDGEGGFIGDLSTDIERLFDLPKTTTPEASEKEGKGTGVAVDPELEKIKAEAEAAKIKMQEAQAALKKAQSEAEKAKKEADKAKLEAANAKKQVDTIVSESQKIKDQLKEVSNELAKAQKETARAKTLLEQAEQARKKGEAAKANQLADEAKKAQQTAQQAEAAAKKSQVEAEKKQADLDRRKAQAEKEQQAREAAAKAKEEAEKKAELAAQEKAKQEALAKKKAEDEARRKSEAEAKAKANESNGNSGSGGKAGTGGDVKSSVQTNKISQAIGAVNKGRLENGINLHKFFGEIKDRGVEVIRPERKAYYATNELTHIMDIISKMSYNLTPGYKSSIGDVSKEKGGKLFRHKSHQMGVDADIAFYFKNKTFQGYLASAVAVNKLHPDWMYEQQWTMFKKIQETGFIDRIFIHPLMKKKLCEHAIKLGELKKDDTKSLAAQTLRRLVPEKDHHDHYHLRVKCSSAQVRCRQMAEPRQGSGCF